MSSWLQVAMQEGQPQWQLLWCGSCLRQATAFEPRAGGAAGIVAGLVMCVWYGTHENAHST